MCRLFGFKSVLQSQIHQSLVNADNAIAKLSEEHPDGWGVAYYVEDAPHIIKSENKAIEDKIFKKVSGVVTSHTVLAHIRNATLGNKSILNTHPFQYGPWVFGHNGNVKNFSVNKNKLLRLVDPKYIRFILGETDSEILFFIILSEVLRSGLNKKSIAAAIEKIVGVIGPIETDPNADNSNTFLSFIMTNGKSMVAFQGGKSLYYSTHKSKCPESGTCNFFNQTCENRAANKSIVNHLLISSDPLSGQNEWTAMKTGELIILNNEMEFNLGQII